jgi:membrane protein
VRFPPAIYVRTRAVISVRWSAVQDRLPSVRHVAAAWKRLSDYKGGQYAGAIAYYSFLALFPLLLLAASVTGFVLQANKGAQQDLLDAIARNIPGDFGTTVADSVNTFIANRTSVGLIALAGVLLTGLGWVGNLRTAIEVMWGRLRVQRNVFVLKLSNLLVLAGLGLGALLSLGLTIFGTSLTDQVVQWVGLDDVPGIATGVKFVGILLAVLGDWVIFTWLLIRLPGVTVPARVAFRGALLAAVGFEVLKIVGTYTVAHSAQSLTAGPFASVIAVLIWMQLVARWVLYSAAWMAVVTEEVGGDPYAAALVDGAAPAARGEF